MFMIGHINVWYIAGSQASEFGSLLDYVSQDDFTFTLTFIYVLTFIFIYVLTLI